MKPNLKDFPKPKNKLGESYDWRYYAEHIVNDWKDAFEKQLQHILKELKKTDDTDGTYNPFNITYPYNQFWQKKIREILGEK